ASQLFNRYGIKSISMEELSRQLGISKKTLYQHFTDKNDLVEKTIFYTIEQKGCFIKRIYEQNLNAVEEMFAVFKYVNEMIRNHNPSLDFDLQRFYPQIFRKVREFHRTNVYETTLSNLIKGKEEGFYRADLNEDIIAKLHVMRIENLMHSDVVTHEELHSNQFFKELFKYHIYGIISPKGIQFIDTNYPEFYTNE
ncbi:MAG: TetR/AcrR family transcriptional regulator, partial [Ignavibacteria bacterium]|nr:TetR/AcrR family transcriptional regulator [Ignavibacteria bacterium]